MDKLHAFVDRFDGKDIPEVGDSELTEICSILSDHLIENTQSSLKVLQCLSYFTLDVGARGPLCLETFKKAVVKLIDNSKFSQDEILTWFIERLRPLLLRISDSEGKSTNNALKPRIGMSYKEDDARKEWKEKGGLKSIPLFYVVLLHLKNRHVSSNLWWITPGILNILDDTTDVFGVKLKGVFLLKVLLEHCFDDQKNWVSFSDLGLFDLYRPLLLNMCYYLPPSYDPDISLQIMRTVFPALSSLYRLQFINSDLKYKYYLGKFLSEIVLQNLIPRVNFTNESLTEYSLQLACTVMGILGKSTTVHLQRTIYVLGEYLVRNPFFTAFDSLVNNTLNVIVSLIDNCSQERIVAHRYDFLGLLLITFEKCKREGKLTPAVLNKLQGIRRLLETAGCDFTDDESEIVGQRDVHEFFN